MSLRLPLEEYQTLCRGVLNRDNWKCRKCGYRQNLHCHHIIYRSSGGVDESWNLITLCELCHSKVHAYELFISVAEGNWVGPGGGANGTVVFTYAQQ